MLIERMQTHPEDFHYGGKCYELMERPHVSARDKKAINEAHDTYIKEPRLMVSMLEALMAQPEEDEKVKYKVQGRYGAAIAKGEGQPIFNPNTDSYTLTDKQRITREMYENHIQTHKKLIQDKATKASTKVTEKSILSDIYNKALGRERIERDN